MNFFEMGGLIIELDSESGNPQIPVEARVVLAAGEKSYSNSKLKHTAGMSDIAFMNASSRRDRTALIAMIDEAPSAPPGAGLPGAAWNLLKKAPGFFVDVQQYSMTPRFVFERAERLENR
jgi:hypothetical protein